VVAHLQQAPLPGNKPAAAVTPERTLADITVLGYDLLEQVFVR